MSGKKRRLQGHLKAGCWLVVYEESLFMSTPDLVSIERAAEFLGVTTRTVRLWISSGELPALRLGKRLIRIDYEDLRNFCKPIHRSY
jgi:excisionase family DNA binding protein